MRPVFFIPLALFLFFAGLAGYMLTQDKNQLVPSAMIDKPLPEFNLPPATEGIPGTSRADFVGGEPKLLNIWASWCLPCIAEAPQLEQLNEAGVEIIGIAIRDKPEDVAQFLGRYGNPYSKIGADDISALQIEIGAAGVPETFVIDGEGNIRYQHIGDIRESDVPKLLGILQDVR
ncbi:DsbE family thiol:disulfide interchange protein [Erythrobacter sp. THAF29]|uniref:DsbE family thiol:disulfide interchange protein n=1 Tax=Erythrobacter sp. THAF29 TaxID=2587851 RepID=UPI00126882D0|nr:DsbE family thiol:disulfide interchange protein [Erythrobacter sp. THAF29]QFT77460.1 Thiol:disulfide interchange protein CycY precursor [Erythrobacter sp. THAF29]